MYNIEMHQVSKDFALCWNTALNHIETKGREVIQWLKCDLTPPILEHASFRIGNQLFFVRIEDIDKLLETPSTPEGLKTIAKGLSLIDEVDVGGGGGGGGQSKLSDVAAETSHYGGIKRKKRTRKNKRKKKKGKKKKTRKKRKTRKCY